MKFLRTKKEVNQELNILQKKQITIGFVPTMGALHDGHLELVKKAKQNSNIVVVSIFVNPTQFNNKEDFENYPNTISKDLELLDQTGVDLVFVPDIQEIYPAQPSLSFDFGKIERVLEGAFRPGHFNGVAIVVSKLLNIVKPHQVYFGQKDLQQVMIVRRLVEDLSFNTEIVIIPTVREADGLAMSSRNLRLSLEQRAIAPLLYKALLKAKDELLKGNNWLAIREKINLMFKEQPGVQLEYFELVSTERFELLEEVSDQSGIAICTAAFIGNIRLIDNISIFD
ncbi:pantoate--beta-alanine ligase [Aquiflexum balticum DSM 16537]|uniref:Pantothenate synthetase n=1 Tax=Aquiflexum balticum DSM 16537 TaxID=758820 RepID=A0A1W2H1Z0_9BACT|nr:pantoate--beta-alanine ligase [Aquiflexum balticum]SMD42901.1 pantoate--beta-alanine ligase [Aquiflexum balticum DSM 16537]